jgi:threonine/homoserine/homoserine lactone efflux protein
MLTLEQIALYLPAVALIIAIPGQDMLMSLSRGLSQGRAAACAYAGGVAVGIMVHTVLAALGVSVLLRASETAFTLFKLAGGLYLFYLGVQLWRAQGRAVEQARAPLLLPALFASGALSNVLNPKVALFVLALVPQFVVSGSGVSAGTQILALGGIFAVATWLAYAGLGAAAGRAQAWMMAKPQVLAGFNRFTAGVFMVAGLGVFTLERR